MSKLGVGEPFLWGEMLLIPNIINVCLIAFMLITIWIYNNRRHFFPIKGRGSHPVLLVSWIYVMLLVSCAARGPTWPCVIDQMIYITGAQCSALIYLYRVAVLLVRNDIASEISLGGGGSTRNLFRKRRSCLHGTAKCRLLDTRKWNYFLIFYGIFMLAAVLAAAALIGDDWNCDLSTLTLASNLMMILIHVPLMSWMACKLRHYPADGRHISREFRATGFFTMGALIVYTVVSQTTDLAYPSIYFLDVVGVGVFCFSMCYPIYLTYAYQRTTAQAKSLSSRGSLSCSIEVLLQSEGFRQAFLAHLKKEFNAESLIFWQSVLFYKEQGERPAEEMLTDITEMIDTYLGRGALYQLNISDEAVQRTLTIVQEAKESGKGLLHVFDQLLDEVVSLMKNDPFPRFLRTPAGREFIAAANESSSTTPRVVKEVLMSAFIPHHTPNPSISQSA